MQLLLGGAGTESRKEGGGGGIPGVYSKDGHVVSCVQLALWRQGIILQCESRQQFSVIISLTH